MTRDNNPSDGNRSEIMDWDRAHRLARLCQLSYCDEEEIVNGLTADGFLDVIIQRVGDLRYFAVLGKDEVVVVFRGSANLGNWMTNINAFGGNLTSCGDVHPGFFISAAQLEEEWKRKVEELDPENRCGIWFAGHSLGGALAYVAATQIADADRVRGICTFGMPRTGKTGFSQSFEKRFPGRVFRFASKGDPVPRLPPSRMKFAHAGARIYFDGNGAVADMERGDADEEFSDEEIEKIEGIFASREKVRGRDDEPVTLQDEVEDEAVRGVLPGIRNHLMGSYVGEIIEAIVIGDDFPSITGLLEKKPLPTPLPVEVQEELEKQAIGPEETEVLEEEILAELEKQDFDSPPFGVHVLWGSGKKGDKSSLAWEMAESMFRFLNHSMGFEEGGEGMSPIESGAGIPVYAGHHFDRVKEILENGDAGSGRSGSKVAIALLFDAQYREDPAYQEFVDWLFDESRGGIERFRETGKAIVVPIWIDRNALPDLPGELNAIDVRDTAISVTERKRTATWEYSIEVARFLARSLRKDTDWNQSARGDGSDQVKIFVSYAHGDAEINGDIADFLGRHPKSRLGTIFDVQNFARGEDLNDEIQRHQRNAITLVVNSDSYAASPYCQDEILNAKSAGMPIVTLQVLREGRGRSFPYEANTITLASQLILNGKNQTSAREKARIAERCSWICLRAWLHHLHFHLDAGEIFRRRDIGLFPDFLSRPPELLDLVDKLDRSSLILYPDPPLGTAEEELLRRSNRRVRLATPTTFSRETMRKNPAPPLHGMRVAFSLSASPELAERFHEVKNEAGGMALPHLNGIAEHLTLSLIRSGAELGYGGHFGEKSYTDLLAKLIHDHKRVRKSTEQLLFSYLSNHFPKPLAYKVKWFGDTPLEDLPDDHQSLVVLSRHEGAFHVRVFDRDREKILDAPESELPFEVLGKLKQAWDSESRDWNNTYSILIELSRLTGHQMRPEGHAEVQARIIEVEGVESDSLQPYEEGINYSLMRKWMAHDSSPVPDERSCDARVVVGGKTVPKLSDPKKNPDTGYAGRFPGQAEEVWQHLKAGKPVYIVGGFLGSTRQVASALCNELQGLPTEDQWRMKSLDHYYSEYCDRFDDNRPKELGDLPDSLGDLWKDLASFGKGYFWGDGASEEQMWINGLTVAENRRLFVSDQYDEISALVIKGLCECRMSQERESLGLALFHGSIVDVLDVDGYGILILGSARLRGADAALDEKLNGEIGKALEAWQLGSPVDRAQDPIIPVNTNQLSGDFVIPCWIDDLSGMGGDSDSAARWLEEEIEKGLAKIAAKAESNELRSLAIVPMGLNLGLTVDRFVEMVIEVFSRLSGRLKTLVLCELDAGRYRELKLILERKRDSNPQLDLIELTSRPLGKQVLPMYLQFQGRENEGSDFVTQVVRGPEGTASVPFQDRGIAWQELEEEFAGWGKSAPPFERHEELGDRLVNWFFGGEEINRAVSREGASRPWDVLHDVRCSMVPYELMRVNGDFPALTHGIRRGLLTRNQPYFAPPVRRGVYYALLIVDPENNLPQAYEEGVKILALLENEFGRDHSLPRMKIKTLFRAEATVSAVLGEVASGKYDLIHYAGHGHFDARDPEQSGLQLADGTLNAASLQEVLKNPGQGGGVGSESGMVAPHPPALVILNACLQSKLLQERNRFGVSLAQAILESGVGGFIGNRWNVGDRSARIFAVKVFSELINGTSLGEAIRRGRLLLSDRRSRDWCNYVFYGSPEIRL